MDTLPNELIIEIFNLIQKITDKRQFLRACKYYNNITKQSILYYEKNYQNSHLEHETKYSVEKFTCELCHDKYFELIPEHYITKSNSALVMASVFYNDLDLLKKAKQIGCDLREMIDFAALGGHRSLLLYGSHNGYEWNEWTCANAALGGHLHILSWLRNIGCPWNQTTCDFAIMGGHLHVFKWARIMGCHWDKTSFDILNCKNEEIVNWLKENEKLDEYLFY